MHLIQQRHWEWPHLEDILMNPKLLLILGDVILVVIIRDYLVLLLQGCTVPLFKSISVSTITDMMMQ